MSWDNFIIYLFSVAPSVLPVIGGDLGS